MAVGKIDLRIKLRKQKPTNNGRVSVAVPRDIEIAYYKIPTKERNDLMREIIEAFVRENTN